MLLSPALTKNLNQTLMSESTTSIKNYPGPNQYLPHKAIVFQFSQQDLFNGDDSAISTENISAFKKWLAPEVYLAITSETALNHPNQLILTLTQAIQNGSLNLNLRATVNTQKEGLSYIAIEYIDFKIIKTALLLSIEFVLYLKGISQLSDLSVENFVKRAFPKKLRYHIDQTTLALIKAAEKLNIPSYYLAHSRSVICYGQGVHSLFFQMGSSQLDSGIGTWMQNKVDTHALLDRMGYPSPEQVLAYNLKDTLEAAHQIGFPLALKPVHESQGKGVSCDIQTTEELKEAYDLAKDYNKGQVIIEEHVEGFDHRITIAGGKIIEAIARIQPFIVGDGVRSIDELIIEKNKWYKQEFDKGLSTSKGILVDKHLTSVLARLKFDLKSIPKTDEKVYLRKNGNLSTGATFFDVIDTLHPDNIQMFNDIVRVFRMDVVGLDYISPDISKSWKEVGKVLEFNATPALIEEQAIPLLKDKFDHKQSGRIPTLLLIGLSEAEEKQAVSKLEFQNTRLGVTNSKETSLAGNERRFKDKNFYERCLSLLIDPDCEALVMSMTIEELASNGLPIDFIEHCVISDAFIEAAESEEHIAGLLSFLKGFCGKTHSSNDIA